MTRSTRSISILAIVALCAVPAFAQWETSSDIREGSRGTIVGTVVDINETRNELEMQADSDRGAYIRVAADAVTTTYNGFGGMINGKPEIFTGTKGFSNIRTGDRLEVRGTGRGTGAIIAEQISLLGRNIAASPTGVGTTRPPGSASTPTGNPTTTSDRLGSIEGVVRQVNDVDGRIVLETDRREIVTIRASASTPVYYQNQTYRIGNLEPGDRIRIELDPQSDAVREMRARSIEVVRSVQETDTRRVTTLSGRVIRVDRSTDMVRIDTSRGEVRIDLASATDAGGRRVRAADVQNGDRMEVTGRYGTAGDMFIATTVRFVDDVESRDIDDDEDADDEDSEDLGLVTIYGTVTGSLADQPYLVLRDTQNRTVRVHVVEDFVVRARTANTYTTADRLRSGESLVVRAFRDDEGNLIAQTIRYR